MLWFLLLLVLLLVFVAFRDLTQNTHAILKNFPIIGHFRYWLEEIGPELRQYIVTDNDEERPFSRDQRRWVYSSAKKQNNYFGFGTDNDLEESPNYLIIKHAAFPLADIHDSEYSIPAAKIMGGYRKRKKAFRPNSIINVSAMSFGSLSAPAIEALNKGCKIAGSLHNTGEGGISKYHKSGGDLIWQIGTGYFGCRNKDGSFNWDMFLENAKLEQVKAIEIKLSQGAKPGLGGVLPAEKVTAEIAQARGIEIGEGCISPSSHSVFNDIDSMLDFVEEIADKTGLPVGIKSAVGEIDFWRELAQKMKDTNRGVDFITIDGGEGGTGAAPLAFSDHVSLPFKLGFSRVYKEFAKLDMQDNVVFIASGRLGFPEEALFAFALGADMINVAREAMLAIGCIQAQRCHNNHCPTGVATQNKWLIRGLDPTDKAARLANYFIMFRKEVLRLSHACGLEHPALITNKHLEVINDDYSSQSIYEIFDYQDTWGLPDKRAAEEIKGIMLEQN